MDRRPTSIDAPPADRPASEEHTHTRFDEPFYTMLVIRPPGTSMVEWTDVYFFRDKKEPTGWLRFVATTRYDWYTGAAVEKLHKLPLLEQKALQASTIVGLRDAIRQKYQRDGSNAYDQPKCPNTIQGVERWTDSTFKKWGDKL